MAFSLVLSHSLPSFSSMHLDDHPDALAPTLKNRTMNVEVHDLALDHDTKDPFV